MACLQIQRLNPLSSWWIMVACRQVWCGSCECYIFRATGSKLAVTQREAWAKRHFLARPHTDTLPPTRSHLLMCHSIWVPFSFTSPHCHYPYDFNVGRESQSGHETYVLVFPVTFHNEVSDSMGSLLASIWLPNNLDDLNKSIWHENWLAIDTRC